MLQGELIQAADRERQLQMQLDKTKEFEKWLEQRVDLQKHVDDFKLEQEMKQRDSKFIGLH